MRLGELESVLVDVTKETGISLSEREFELGKYFELDSDSPDHLLWSMSSMKPFARRFFSTYTKDKAETMTGEYFLYLPGEFKYKSLDAVDYFIGKPEFGESLKLEIARGDELEHFAIMCLDYNFALQKTLGVSSSTDADHDRRVLHDDLPKSMVLLRSFDAFKEQRLSQCKERLTGDLVKLIKTLK